MEQKKVREPIRVDYQDVDNTFDELAGGVTNSKLGTLLTAEALALMSGDKDMAKLRSSQEVIGGSLEKWAERFANEDFEKIADEEFGFLISYYVKRLSLSHRRHPEAGGKLRDWWNEDAKHPWLTAYKQKIKQK